MRMPSPGMSTCGELRPPSVDRSRRRPPRSTEAAGWGRLSLVLPLLLLALPATTLAAGASPLHGLASPRASHEAAVRLAPPTSPKELTTRLVPAATGWTNLTSSISNSPPTLADNGLVYDAQDGYLLLFGGAGCGVSGASCAGGGVPVWPFTWALYGGSWKNLTGTTVSTPPARAGGAMVYDGLDHEVLLFGGCVSTSGAHLVGNTGCYDQSDTWAFAGGTWTNLTASAGAPPSPRADAAITYDSAATRVVLFGGCTSFLGYLCGSEASDTWAFRSGVWSPLSTNPGPGPRAGAGFAHDPADGYSVLFGGVTWCGNPCSTTGDTWTLSGVTWTSLAPVNSPSARGFMEGSFDTVANDLMFYGGWKGDFQGGSTTAPPSGFYGDTWQFAAGSWSNVTAGLSASPGPDAWNMDYDPAYTSILGFGGWGTQVFGSNTWSFAGPVSLPALTVGISANPTSGTAPLSVSFTGSATGGTPPYSWNYSFGDGSYNSCCSILSHTYTAVGTFIVNLTVHDANGAVGYKTATITVSPASSVVVSLSANPTGGAPPLTVYFNGGASGGTGPYTFRWSFGDGATFTWSNASTGGRIAHTYVSTGTFVANLTATDQAGTMAWQTATLAVGTSPPPSVTLSANPTTGPYPLTVYFQGGASGGSSPYAFLWTFGDGTSLNWTNTSTSVRVAHTFTAGGSFQVSLRATDASGVRGERSLFVTVTVPGSTSPLSSTATASPLSGTPPLSVSFASSIQGGKGPYTWVWFLADGTPSFWQNCSSPNCPTFQHTYSNRGTYMVEAELSDSSSPSQVNKHYTNVTVGAGGPGNSLSVNVNCQPTTSNGPPGGTAPLSISCQASATGGVPPYTFRWNIANSTYFSTSGINYTFQNPGDFYVNLTVTDHVGNKAYTSGIVHVTPGNGPGTGGIGSGGPLDLGAPGGVPTLYVIVGVVALFAAGIVQLALARRRRRALLAAGAGATPAAAGGGSPPIPTAAPAPGAGPTPFEAPSIVETASPPSAPPWGPGVGTGTPPPAAAARKCTSCGAELEVGAGFCDSCGSPVPEGGPSA